MDELPEAEDGGLVGVLILMLGCGVIGGIAGAALAWWLL